MRCDFPRRPRSQQGQQQQDEAAVEAAEAAAEPRLEEAASAEAQAVTGPKEEVEPQLPPPQHPTIRASASSSSVESTGSGPESAGSGPDNNKGDDSDSGMSGRQGQPDPEPEKGGAASAGNNEDYQVYFYDPKDVATLNKVPPPEPAPKETPAPHAPPVNKKHTGLGIYILGANGQRLDVFRNLRHTIEDPWEVLFMRAEGIHAHGYHAHACQVCWLVPSLNAINDTLSLQYKGHHF